MVRGNVNESSCRHLLLLVLLSLPRRRLSGVGPLRAESKGQTLRARTDFSSWVWVALPVQSVVVEGSVGLSQAAVDDQRRGTSAATQQSIVWCHSVRGHFVGANPRMDLLCDTHTQVMRKADATIIVVKASVVLSAAWFLAKKSSLVSSLE
jgi:hypothetical protein